MKMKKILGLLFVPVLAVGIAGCGKDKKEEPTVDPITFEEYLQQSDTFTVEKLNENIGPIKTDYDVNFSSLNITNSKLTVTIDDQTKNAYLWAKTEDENKILYLAEDAEDESIQTLKINLSTIDQTINEVKEGMLAGMEGILVDTNESGNIEASEVIDNYLSASIPSVDKTTLEDIFSKFDFSIDDFNDKGNGVYELKASSLIELVSKITGASSEDIAVTEEEVNEMMNVQVKFANNNIKQIKTSLTIADVSSGEVYTINVSFDFEYTNFKFSKVSITSSIQVSENTAPLNNSVPEYFPTLEDSIFSSYIYSKLVIGSNEFSYTIKTGESALEIENSMSQSIIKEGNKVTISSSNTMADVISSNAKIVFIGNWISEAKINASLNSEEGKIEISAEVVSNVNVQIPTEYSSLEGSSYDATEDLINILLSSIPSIGE